MKFERGVVDKYEIGSIIEEIFKSKNWIVVVLQKFGIGYRRQRGSLNS